jgi:D-3-phosphoglycerate dehydrogenase
MISESNSVDDLGHYRVIRLNREISPVDEFEMRLYQKLGIQPVQVETRSTQELIEQVRSCDAVLVVSAELPGCVIDQMKKCRVICRLGVGVDKIDVVTATRSGIVVTNVPDCFSEEMAEHVMAMILGLARKLPQMDRAIREGAWRRSRQLSIQNQRLSETTLGLVGFGDSAQNVAKLASVFGMQVLATRRNWQQATPAAEHLGVQMVDLDTLLEKADFVSLHIPLNTETHHLIDAATLRKLKPGAYLINTARGAIVDEIALVQALKEGRLGGAALDTFELINPFSMEETVPSHPLFEMDNVILTPHVAALSAQGMKAVAMGGIKNLEAVLRGFWPAERNIVNFSVIPRFSLKLLSTVDS